ncbi:GNAT family N-acetyltransferase [Paenibacillus sp. IITD108]
MSIAIRYLAEGEAAPMPLLLLADPSEKLVQQYLKSGHCLVAEENGEIVGVIVLVKKASAKMEIINVAVAEACQGKGIGKQLIKRAIQEASQLGAKTLEVGTGNSSIYQLLLYQKCGFRITEVEKDFFIKHYDEPIIENGIPCVDMIRLSMNL